MNVGLRKKYQQVLILKYIDELSNYEIGLRMGYTSETVANLLSKARKQFNYIIEHEKEVLPEELKPYILLLDENDG